MVTIDLNTTPHKFEKENLVTLPGNYDIFKCKECGIKGKTTSLATLSVKSTYSKDKVQNCVGGAKKGGEVRGKVKVTTCNASGGAFLNATPGSIHSVITPPEGYSNDDTGVWVMGNGEPIKLLPREFTSI